MTSADLDTLARALDKARSAFERRDSEANYVALLEAEVAYLRRWGQIEKGRAARELSAVRGHASKLQKLVDALKAARGAGARNRASKPVGVPLLEHAGVGS